jgi:hypothetical protein
MPMLKIKMTRKISYPELLKYLKSKYPGDKFIIQVIKGGLMVLLIFIYQNIAVNNLSNEHKK